MKNRIFINSIFAAILCCGPANAAIVEIVAEGTLFDVSMFERDALNLDGATFRQIIRYDTAAESFRGSSNSIQEQSFFRALFAEVSFSNRPNGAADETIAYTSADVIATNALLSSTTSDQLNFRGSLIVESTFLEIGGNFALVFQGNDFIPGSSSPELPTFSADDVTSSGFFGFGGNVFDGLPFYRISDARFSVNVIPVPAAVWLFASALIGLGWFRRG